MSFLQLVILQPIRLILWPFRGTWTLGLDHWMGQERWDVAEPVQRWFGYNLTVGPKTKGQQHCFPIPTASLTWGECSYLSGLLGYGQTASDVRATLDAPSEIHNSFCAVLSSREMGTQSERVERKQTQTDMGIIQQKEQLEGTIVN